MSSTVARCGLAAITSGNTCLLQSLICTWMHLSLQTRILSTRTVPMPRARSIPSLSTHIGIGVAYVALAVLHSYPLIRHLDSSLPGLGLGDNVTFVWNSWWMRQALASPTRIFFTPMRSLLHLAFRSFC